MNIFENILKDKIDLFISQFCESSRRLFYDQEKKALIHPGEFGSYRENVCREFLKNMTPSKYEFSSGFIINSKGKISTQCDLILYDLQNTPLIQDSESQRFFPVETIVSICEVKSVLSKGQLSDALIKLSKIKEIRDEIESPTILYRSNQKNNYEPDLYHYDQIFSVLICERLDFDYNDIVNEFDSIYSEVKVTHRHNMILSINDGLFLYFDKNNKSMMYPFHNNVKLLNRMVKAESDKYCFLKLFSSYMFLGTSSTTILYPELTSYIGSISGGININESFKKGSK